MNLVTVKIKKAGYDSKKETIRNIHFSLKEGELVGLIGPNGAGKSTTIKALMGMLEHVDGEIVFQKRTTFAYVPERPIFYDDLTFQEHIDFVAAVEQLPQKEYKEEVARLLHLYGLEQVVHQLPSTFSKGMQQKAMLVLAFMTKPSIYIIDEPFVGLDPMAMKYLLSSIEKEKERGAGILLSTHVLDTAEKVCDRFLLVNNGSLQLSGKLKEIQTQCNLPGSSLFDCFIHIVEGMNER